MSAEIRTRHLIVTLPDVTGEEADTIASDLKEYVVEHQNHGIVLATVDHALDEAPLDGCKVGAPDWQPGLVVANIGGSVTVHTPDDARRLAAHLLRAAGKAEAGSDR